MKRKSTRKTPIVEPDRPLRCHTCGRAVAGFESVHYGSIEGSELRIGMQTLLSLPAMQSIVGAIHGKSYHPKYRR